MSERITGFFLLFVGIFFVIGCSLNVYFVFTKQLKPVELFKYSGISIDPSAMMPALPNNSSPSTVKPVEIVSAAMINDSSNLLAHIFLMSFLSGAGFKIASLGIQLLRPIKVNLKTKDGTTIDVT